MRSWRDVLINDSQSSKACRTDDGWIKMKNSYDPIYLLPDDPFEMNKVSGNDAGRRIFGENESSIGRSTNDCTVCGGVPILDLGYQRRKPLLSSFETQLKYEGDFNNIGLSELGLDLTGAGKLGAFEGAGEASILEREMVESVVHLIEDESVGTSEHIKKDLVLGRSSLGSVNDVAGNQSLGAYEDVEWIEMNNSYNPIHLLPDDPFEMNKVSENDADERVFGEIESSIEPSTDDCTMYSAVPIVDSSYQRRKPHLSSFETQVNYGDDLNNTGSSELALDLSGAGKLGAFEAEEEASILERELAESIFRLIDDETVGTFEHIKKDLVLGRSSPCSVIEIAGNQRFGACEDVEEILYTVRRHAKLSEGDVNYLHKQIISTPKYWVVRDLLSVGDTAIQNNPLLCRSIHIDPLLGEKITDDEPLLEEPPNLHILHDDHCRENCAYIERCAEDFEKQNIFEILLNEPPELHFLHDEIYRCKETGLGQEG